MNRALRHSADVRGLSRAKMSNPEAIAQFTIQIRAQISQ